MKITPSSLSYCDLSIYHDSEISQFVVDYTNHRVQIPLKSTYTYANEVSEKISMSFNNVKSLCLNIDEKWGPGIYIYEITIVSNHSNEDKPEQTINTTILLNSGDMIHIIYESIEIQQ